MITFNFSTEVTEDRRVVVVLPPETPVGTAEFVITVEPRTIHDTEGGSLESLFGTIDSGDHHSSDNERIDADLAREYGSSSEAT